MISTFFSEGFFCCITACRQTVTLSFFLQVNSQVDTEHGRCDLRKRKPTQPRVAPQTRGRWPSGIDPRAKTRSPDRGSGCRCRAPHSTIARLVSRRLQCRRRHVSAAGGVPIPLARRRHTSRFEPCRVPAPYARTNLIRARAPGADITPLWARVACRQRSATGKSPRPATADRRWCSATNTAAILAIPPPLD